MGAPIRGFPARFPVRDDGARSTRYHAISVVCRATLRAWFGRELSFDGMDRIPHQGPLIMVSNHLSNIDPFLFGGYAPGTWFCMAKRELYRNPAVAWVMAGCNCFPVDRGTADRWALRTALDLLAHRQRLLMFLEGTRAAAPGMKRAEAGVGFLARRSGAAILPVGVWGTEQALPRGRRLPRRVPVRVRFGSAFTPELPSSGRPDDQALADQIARHVAALLPAPYRGVYG